MLLPATLLGVLLLVSCTGEATEEAQAGEEAALALALGAGSLPVSALVWVRASGAEWVQASAQQWVAGSRSPRASLSRQATSWRVDDGGVAGGYRGPKGGC